MNAVKEKAYAKINLYLDVLSKREDGFPGISTVMHSVSLYDEITVTLLSTSKCSVKLSLEGNKRLPVDSKNLSFRAAELFLSRSGINAELHISLNKRIPVCAGFAGGSSDAAATLRALNRLFKRPFTDKALMKLAEELGSDVPYCVVGGTALCEGRGEIITRLPNTLQLHIVTAIGKEYVSTPAAYSALDSLYSSFDGSLPTGGDIHLARLLSAINGEVPMPRELFNVFESAVLPTCPIAEGVKARMLSLGAVCSLMSGSGAGVFGIFDSEGTALSAAEELKKEGVSAHYAKSV